MGAGGYTANGNLDTSSLSIVLIAALLYCSIAGAHQHSSERKEKPWTKNDTNLDFYNKERIVNFELMI